MKQETVPEIHDTYGVSHWSAGYFDINSAGNINVRPSPGDSRYLDLKELVSSLVDEGRVQLPMVLRFPQLLASQLQILSNAFKQAIEELQYTGRHFPVFPMKVNPRQEVVREFLLHHEESPIGVECGSKAELYAAIAQQQCEQSLLICNGFKDETFVRMAIMAAQAGKRAVVVVEKLNELRMILRLSRELGAAPWIGLRAKLYSRGSGKWSSSGGDSSKFGLTTSEILECIRLLEEAGLSHRCNLIHFHIGSQITEIQRVKNAMKEAARVYSNLRRLGANIDFVDIGGGLGVDYSGARTSHDSSLNYGVQEFANDVVYAFKVVCDEDSVTYPHLVTESGRFMSAYHSVFVTDIRDEIETFADDQPEVQLDPDDPHVLSELKTLCDSISSENYGEYYHDAITLKDELQMQFSLGMVNLGVRAKGDVLFWEICARALHVAEEGGLASDEFEQLKSNLATKYLCNFSLFRSVPDSWAIQQLFPVIPMQNLHLRPTQYATLVDVTCDSDGIIDRFVDGREEKCTLLMHEWQPGQAYFVGIFLVGAYQDVMGNHHNLFGHPNEAHVTIEDDGRYTVHSIVPGSQIRDMLEFARYDEETLQLNYQKLLDEQVARAALSPQTANTLSTQYRDIAAGSTFLD